MRRAIGAATTGTIGHAAWLWSCDRFAERTASKAPEKEAASIRMCSDVVILSGDGAASAASSMHLPNTKLRLECTAAHASIGDLIDETRSPVPDGWSKLLPSVALASLLPQMPALAYLSMRLDGLAEGERGLLIVHHGTHLTEGATSEWLADANVRGSCALCVVASDGLYAAELCEAQLRAVGMHPTHVKLSPPVTAELAHSRIAAALGRPFEPSSLEWIRGTIGCHSRDLHALKLRLDQSSSTPTPNPTPTLKPKLQWEESLRFEPPLEPPRGEAAAPLPLPVPCTLPLPITGGNGRVQGTGSGRVQGTGNGVPEGGAAEGSVPSVETDVAAGADALERVQGTDGLGRVQGTDALERAYQRMVEERCTLLATALGVADCAAACSPNTAGDAAASATAPTDNASAATSTDNASSAPASAPASSASSPLTSGVGGGGARCAMTGCRALSCAGRQLST